MQTLVITPKPPNKNSLGRPAKTRSFQAIPLGYVTADDLWKGGHTSADERALRPVWWQITQSDHELHVFRTNLRLGYAAELVDMANTSYSSRRPPRFELLKTGGYAWFMQRMPDGISVATAYQPELLALDPGMIDPERCQFVCLTPTWWLAQEQRVLWQHHEQCAAILAHARALELLRESDAAPDAHRTTFTADELLDLVPQAARVTAYIEKRTTRPIIKDLAFAVQLYLSGLQQGILTLSPTVFSHQQTVDDRQADGWVWARHTTIGGFREWGTEQVGLARRWPVGSSTLCWKGSWPVRCSVTGWPAAAGTCRSRSPAQRKHHRFRGRNYGSSTLRRGRRLLSDAAAPHWADCGVAQGRRTRPELSNSPAADCGAH